MLRIKKGAARYLAGIVMAGLLIGALAACGSASDSDGETNGTSEATTTIEPTRLVLASTTSTQDSGLFDVLIPAFEAAYPEYSVDVIAVGTGEALALGEAKDADVLLVHAKAKEEAFVADGYGTERRDVMYNDFIVVGPASDPAGIAGMTVAADAFAKIATSASGFVSRGDDSGTHTKELSIWKSAAIEPAGDWYVAAGQGMGDVLKMASEMQAYTLSDRATYLSLKSTLDLEVVVEGDSALFNQYGVIPVTDATNAGGAQAFADWICSDGGQAVIAAYGVEEYGQPLFIPNAE